MSSHGNLGAVSGNFLILVCRYFASFRLLRPLLVSASFVRFFLGIILISRTWTMFRGIAFSGTFGFFFNGRLFRSLSELCGDFWMILIVFSSFLRSIFVSGGVHIDAARTGFVTRSAHSVRVSLSFSMCVITVGDIGVARVRARYFVVARSFL